MSAFKMRNNRQRATGRLPYKDYKLYFWAQAQRWRPERLYKALVRFV